MPNNNNLIPKENLAKVEIVQELKDEYKIPSYEEFMKTYEGGVNYDDLNGGDIGNSKGYGPCGRDGCYCSCNWKKGCSCQWDSEMWTSERGCEHQGVFRSSGKANISLWDGEEFKPNARLEINNSVSAATSKRIGEEIKVLSLSTGGSASLNKDKVELKGKLGVDVYDFKDEHKQVRIGLNVDTGGSINDDGAEAKFLGFGVSVGKYTGISTPLGEAKFNTDDCIIQ